MSVTPKIANFKVKRVLGRYNIDKFIDEIIIPNTINIKGAKKQKVFCVQEMSGMLECLTKNDHLEAECYDEIRRFKLCCVEHRETVAQLKREELDYTYRPGKRPNNKQISRVFKEWQAPIDKHKISRVKAYKYNNS